MSNRYMEYLRPMLIESMRDTEGLEEAQTLIDHVLSILEERRQAFARKRVPLVSIVGAQELERMLHFGLIGRFGLRETVRRGAAPRPPGTRSSTSATSSAASRSASRSASWRASLRPRPSRSTKHKDHSASRSALPMGDQPNISSGIALATRCRRPARLSGLLCPAMGEGSKGGGRRGYPAADARPDAGGRGGRRQKMIRLRRPSIVPDGESLTRPSWRADQATRSARRCSLSARSSAKSRCPASARSMSADVVSA